MKYPTPEHPSTALYWLKLCDVCSNPWTAWSYQSALPGWRLKPWSSQRRKAVGELRWWRLCKKHDAQSVGE